MLVRRQSGTGRMEEAKTADSPHAADHPVPLPDRETAQLRGANVLSRTWSLHRNTKVTSDKLVAGKQLKNCADS